MWNTDSEHTQPPGEPARYCHLAGAATESSKGRSTVLLNQVLQGGGEFGNISEFHEHGPIATLLLL